MHEKWKISVVVGVKYKSGNVRNGPNERRTCKDLDRFRWEGELQISKRIQAEQRCHVGGIFV